jgi:hypothetical protein
MSELTGNSEPKMSLQKWLEYGWLRSHLSSRKEISDILRIIDRNLQDAVGDISTDWRFSDKVISLDRHNYFP